MAVMEPEEPLALLLWGKCLPHSQVPFFLAGKVEELVLVMVNLSESWQ